MPLTNDGFRHLDPTVTKVYQATVLYGFETKTQCLMLKVKKGYVIETPLYHKNKTKWSWIRGQHIDTLAPFFMNIKPLRIV